MKNLKYQYKSEKKFKHFEFFSKGPKGLVRKMVEYSETGRENVFNLAFGDYDEETKSINDLSVTNNGDSLKVLATVASTVYAFTEKNPRAMIFATGSSDARTRLYRMGITNHLFEIQKDFDVFGLRIDDNIWEKFITGEDYEAFLLTKRGNYENEN